MKKFTSGAAAITQLQIQKTVIAVLRSAPHPNKQ